MSLQSASGCALALIRRICISSIRKAAMLWPECWAFTYECGSSIGTGETQMTRKSCATVTFAVLLVCAGLEAQSGAPASAPDVRTGIYDPSLDARVETLLRRMTLDEKVGQVVQYSAGQPTGPGTNRTDYEDMIAKGQIGALFNISTAKETNRYQRIAVEKSRLKIPIIFGLDVIHGFRTVFPVPLALA